MCKFHGYIVGYEDQQVKRGTSENQFVCPEAHESIYSTIERPDIYILIYVLRPDSWQTH